MIRRATPEEIKDSNRVEVMVNKNGTPLMECEGYPVEQAPVDPDDIVLIYKGIRHKFYTSCGLSFYYRSEEHDSTIEAYRAQPNDPFTVRIPKKD